MLWDRRLIVDSCSQGLTAEDMRRCELVCDQVVCIPPARNSDGLAIADGGQLVAFRSHAGVGGEIAVKVWSVADQSCVAFLGYPAPPLLSFSSDGQQLVIGGDCEWSASVWDIETSKQLRWIGRATDGFFTAALFSPDSSSVVLASREPNWEEFDLWCTKTGDRLRALQGYIFHLMFSADGEHLAGFDEQGRHASIVSISTLGCLLVGG